MRTRRGRRGRATIKRKTDWVLSASGSAFETMPFDSVDGVNLLDLQDLEEHQDVLTVERIVGEYSLRIVSPTPDFLMEVYTGIAVRDCDNVGGVIFLNPEDDEDGDSGDWMWRRHYHLTPGVAFDNAGIPTGGAAYSNFDQAHLDVHVRRKMKGRDQLVLFTIAHIRQGALVNQPTQSFNLRTLVKLS